MFDLKNRARRIAVGSRILTALFFALLSVISEQVSAADERWITSVYGNNIDNGSLEVWHIEEGSLSLVARASGRITPWSG